MCEMVLIKEKHDIITIAAMATEIWNAHFTPFIGQAQVDYMLNNFQSIGAIKQQIDLGYEYYLVKNNDTQIGYFAIIVSAKESNMQLSKIYLKSIHQGGGVGKKIITFVKKRCISLGIKELWLNVNRLNSGPIAFYKHMGFVISKAHIQDIGNGFVMDDYKMVMQIAP
ncbi:MAG: GNAT family N-acetyltransferase [Desulfobacteraceae bacterium]